MATMFEAGDFVIADTGLSGIPGASALPKSVRADAESVARTLMDPALCGYPSGNVQLLLDDQATLANIVAGLEKLAQEAKPSDTVFVFFSGHGGQRVGSSGMESFLVPVDYDGDDSLATSLGAEDLSRLPKTIPSSRVTLVLDACHAEGAAFVKDGESAKRVFGRPGTTTWNGCRREWGGWSSLMHGERGLDDLKSRGESLHLLPPAGNGRRNARSRGRSCTGV